MTEILPRFNLYFYIWERMYGYHQYCIPCDSENKLLIYGAQREITVINRKRKTRYQHLYEALKSLKKYDGKITVYGDLEFIEDVIVRYSHLVDRCNVEVDRTRNWHRTYLIIPFCSILYQPVNSSLDQGEVFVLNLPTHPELTYINFVKKTLTNPAHGCRLKLDLRNVFPLFTCFDVDFEDVIHMVLEFLEQRGSPDIISYKKVRNSYDIVVYIDNIDSYKELPLMIAVYTLLGRVMNPDLQPRFLKLLIGSCSCNNKEGLEQSIDRTPLPLPYISISKQPSFDAYRPEHFRLLNRTCW